MQQVLVITGPTASGKTARAFHLADADPTVEIVNADASLLYRGFDIGTAKPTAAELARYPHHLIDVLEPTERFSAADYAKAGREVIRRLIQQGRTPIVVGGTGFYIDALFEGIVETNAPPEATRLGRQRAEKEIEELGFEAMHEKLRDLDPILHAQITRERNPLRLYRAWEFYYATGRPLGEARQDAPDAFEIRPDYHVIQIPRDELWRRIESRTDSMLQNGWLDEVRTLLASSVTPEMPAMRAIGYRELAAVVEGGLTLDTAREQIVIRTRQYAKRQVTWMKKYVNRAAD